MKIHIAQRDDTFEVIANKYGVSVQDLIGMNTHINHLAGLVPGLKVKVPQSNRKEEANVAQHIQKYYPNLDMNPVEVKKEAPIPSIPPKAQQIKVEEEVIPIPLKPYPTEPATHPNEGVKVKATSVVEKEEIKIKMESEPKEKCEETKVVSEQSSGYEEYPHPHMPHPHHHPHPHHPYPHPHPSHPDFSPCQGWDQGWNSGLETASFHSAPPAYSYPVPTSCSQPYFPYDMMRQDERFIGPGWGWGSWGWGPWGWAPWGWGRPPGWGGRPPGWGGHPPGRPPGPGGGRPPGGGPHRSFDEFEPYPFY